MKRRSMLLAPLVALGALLAAAVPAAADDGGLPIQVVIPATSGTSVTNAQLRWSLDAEAGGGAFAGGCNFLSAGAAGSTGSSRVWAQGDGLYSASSGHVRIEKPDASGALAPASWATRCLDPAGAPVASSSTASASGNQVVVDAGTGTVDRAAGTAAIRWTGSFTVVFYGGMTYWSATDPVLVVGRDGTGTLTATASGYQADRDDPTRWVPLVPRTVTLARLSHVTLGPKGFTIAPDYLGVGVSVAQGTPQAARDEANAAWWGSFPQDFVDFQQLTGQGSYWYTSGGVRDAAKVAAPLTVSYDADDALAPPPTAASAGAAPAPSNPLRPAPTSLAAARAEPAQPAGTGVPSGLTAAPASTLLAARPLISGVAGAGADDDAHLAGAWGLLAGLVGLGALGLAKGWLVVPWTRLP